MTNRNTLSPKSEFLSDPKRAGAHQDLVLSPAFKEAAKIAMLEFVTSLGGESADTNKLVTVGLRIEGAKAFLSELLNLGNPTVPLYRKADDELEPT